MLNRHSMALFYLRKINIPRFEFFLFDVIFIIDVFLYPSNAFDFQR